MKISHGVMALAFSLTMVGAGLSHAEPGVTVSRLMNTPISLFSFGIYQLDREIEHLLQGGDGLPLSSPLPDHYKYFQKVVFDWDRNQLVITAEAIRGAAVTRPDSEEECRQVLGAIRTFLGVYSVSGRPLDGKSSNLKYYFSPQGYSLDWQNEKMSKELDSNTLVAFEDIIPGEGKMPFRCEGELVGTGFSIKKQ